MYWFSSPTCASESSGKANAGTSFKSHPGHTWLRLQGTATMGRLLGTSIGRDSGTGGGIRNLAALLRYRVPLSLVSPEKIGEGKAPSGVKS
jgi:hypothetical protein